MIPMNKRLGMLAAILGTSIFGFSFMFSRIALAVASPYVMLMYRFVLAFLTLNLLVAGLRLAGVDHSAEEKVHWLRFSLRGKDVRPLIALGLVQPVIYYLCESYGISLTNSTFSNFLSGQCLEVCILGSMFAITMAIFRMPYISLVSVLVAVTAFIPVVITHIGSVLHFLSPSVFFVPSQLLSAILTDKSLVVFLKSFFFHTF